MQLAHEFVMMQLKILTLVQPLNLMMMDTNMLEILHSAVYNLTFRCLL